MICGFFVGVIYIYIYIYIYILLWSFLYLYNIYLYRTHHLIKWFCFSYCQICARIHQRNMNFLPPMNTSMTLSFLFCLEIGFLVQQVPGNELITTSTYIFTYVLHSFITTCLQQTVVLYSISQEICTRCAYFLGYTVCCITEANVEQDLCSHMASRH